MTRLFVVGFTVLIAAALLRPRFAAAAADEKSATKIVCVGDSITFGGGTKSPRTDSYPAQLARLLGKDYQVINLGVSGTTMLKEGDHPYWKTGQMKRALESKPDVVVIMLGTNDTKPQNWKFKDHYATDYKAMIAEFKKLDTKPKTSFASHPSSPRPATSASTKRACGNKSPCSANSPKTRRSASSITTPPSKTKTTSSPTTSTPTPKARPSWPKASTKPSPAKNSKATPPPHKVKASDSSFPPPVLRGKRVDRRLPASG